MVSQGNIEAELLKSGATFCVEYVGNIEVLTPTHNLDRLGIGKQELATGCALLIAQAAGKILPVRIDPRVQDVIGDVPPKVVCKKIQINVAHNAVFLREIGVRLVLLRKIKTEDIPFGLVLQSEILENAFLFVGKVTEKSKAVKRFAFLFQSQSSPQNISDTFQAAFSILDRETQTRPATLDLPPEPDCLPPPLPTSQPPAMARNIYENIPEDSRHGSMSSETTPVVYGVRQIMSPYVPGSFSLEPGNRCGFVDLGVGSLRRSTDHNYGNVDDHSLATIGSPMSSLPSNLELRFFKICDGLEAEKWFFGPISRPTAESYLKREGDFLVRISGNERFRAVLSVFSGNTIHHVLLNDEHGNVTAQSRPYEKIFDLIKYHYVSKDPLISEEDVKIFLKFPVSRP